MSIGLAPSFTPSSSIAALALAQKKSFIGSTWRGAELANREAAVHQGLAPVGRRVMHGAALDLARDLKVGCMKKIKTAIRFYELTEAEKNRINDALDEARERAGVKKLTREQILEVTETVKGFILRERQRIKEAKKKKEQQIKASAETEFNWSASVKRPVRR